MLNRWLKHVGSTLSWNERRGQTCLRIWLSAELILMPLLPLRLLLLLLLLWLLLLLLLTLIVRAKVLFALAFIDEPLWSIFPV